jgi:hypothetical protein
MPVAPEAATTVQIRLQPQPHAPRADPPPFRVRESWEIPGLIVEPDDDEDDDDDDEGDEDYTDDEDYADDSYYDYEEDEADDRGRAWRGRDAGDTSRRPGGAPLGSYESRRAALSQPQRRRHPARFVLVVLALAGIGFGAVKLFDTRTGVQLTNQSLQPTPPTVSRAPVAPALNAAGTTALTSFAGYPGQQGRDGGQLAVSSVAAGNGQRLAVGSADGYPAIWQQGPGSSWSLADTASNGVLAGRPGNQTLVAAAFGRAGWLAVGGVVSGTQQHPVVVTSADGKTWQAADGSAAFAAPGLYAYGATAGRIDYIIVGERVTGNTVTPAAWWSPGLGTWNQATIAGGSGQASEMFAVTVGKEQFIAVGADGSKPAVWTSPSGQQWTPTDLPLPAGMSKAALREVVSTGTHVVAVGNAVTAQGATIGFAEVSADDGATWHEASLPSPSPQVAVTALAATSAGYVAVGQSGQSANSATTAVVWTSPDGMTWAPARAVPDPAGGKVAAITSLTAAGTTVTGVGIATTKSGGSPVVYMAPTPLWADGVACVLGRRILPFRGGGLDVVPQCRLPIGLRYGPPGEASG